MMLTMEDIGSSLPDPNKQVFPLLPTTLGPPDSYQDAPQPIKVELEAGYHGRPAIELPQIYDQINLGADGEPMGNVNKDALKPTLPNVIQSRNKGIAREGRSLQQAIEKAGVDTTVVIASLSLPCTDHTNNVKKAKPGVKDFDFDDVGKDDLTDRIHAPHPLPYQTKSFRSSVKMKMVPVNKQQRNLFAGLSQHTTLPAPLMKSRIMPVHTSPFLWGQQKQETTLINDKALSPMSLPDKFRAEEHYVKKLRGHKRRYSVPQHRKGFGDLHIGGSTPKLLSKHDYKGEMSDLRNTVVPNEIQELYTGRGFKLPASHSSNRKIKNWQEKLKAEYALPNSAPAAVSIPIATELTTSDTEIATDHSQSADGDADAEISKQQNQTNGNKPHTKVTGKGDHSVQGRGLNNNKKAENAKERSDFKRSEVKKEKTNMKRVPKSKPRTKGNTSGAEKQPLLQMETPNRKLDLHSDTDMDVEETAENYDEPSDELEHTEVIVTEEGQNAENRPTTTRPESEMEIDMTPIDRDISRLAIPFTPTTPKAVSPNPLKSADLSLNISQHRREELAASFRKLDGDKDGHISIAELQTTLPDSLTTGQRRFIKEVYELVSSSTFFGMDEFVTVTCLCEEMLQLSDPLKAAYDEVDISLMEQLISQYAILFATVDRQQTGSISIEALQEILTMALDKDLKIHTQLYQTILQTIDKEYSSSISKVEYLTFLPYFFTCK